MKNKPSLTRPGNGGGGFRNIGYCPFQVVKIPPPLALNGWPDTGPIRSHTP